MKYKLKIEYNGHFFCGWQRQNNGISVQKTLEDAISVFTKCDTKIIGAGRTDAGVHAIEQVAHFSSDKNLDPYNLQKCINNNVNNLPVVVNDIEEVPNDFHSISSAKSRSYIYKIINRRPILTFQKYLYHHEKFPMDIDLLEQAAKIFIGTHDFSSFKSIKCQSKSPIKTIYDVQIEREQYTDAIVIKFNANSFLHHQVRNMVGAMIYVAIGKFSLEYLNYVMEAKNRNLSAPTISPDGLYLHKIYY